MDTPLKEIEKVEKYFIENFPSLKDNFAHPTYQKISSYWMMIFQRLDESLKDLTWLLSELGSMETKERDEIELWLNSFLVITLEGALRKIDEKKVQCFCATIPTMKLEE